METTILITMNREEMRALIKQAIAEALDEVKQPCAPAQPQRVMRLSANSVMELLGISSKETLRQMVKRKLIPAPFKDPGGCVNYWVESDITGYIERRAQPAPYRGWRPVANGRDFLTTSEAAEAINRAPQTLRKWACLENGPIRPIRINGRLAWRASDLRELLEVDSAADHPYGRKNPSRLRNHEF